MGHNDIHDWLDMAFRKVGGDKKAYQRYKREKEREKMPLPKYREPSNYHQLPYGGEVESNSCPHFSGPPTVSEITSSVPNLPAMPNAPGLASLPVLRNNAADIQAPLQNRFRNQQEGFNGGAMLHRRPRLGYQGAPQLVLWGGVPHNSHHFHARNYRHGGFQCFQPASPSPPGSPHGSQHSHSSGQHPKPVSRHSPPGSRNGSQQGTPHETSHKNSTKEPPQCSPQPTNVATARVLTEHYPVGDMTRTYLEGYDVSTEIKRRSSD